MKFDKEYISEADCPEIQGLQRYLSVYDEYANRGGMPIPAVQIILNKKDMAHKNKKSYRDYIVWLPLSHRLDDEICKVCKDNPKWLYMFCTSFDDRDTFLPYEAYIETDEEENLYYQNEDNPLLAKIKLLKELLNG